MRTLTALSVLIVFAAAPPVWAQVDEPRFQVAGHVAGAVSSEFDGTDVGFGGRLSWSPTALIGADAEITFYPEDFSGDLADGVANEQPFSGSRIEGLFGVTVGPRLGAVRPFAKLRPGFLTFNEAPEPIACILIFPPTLRCTLAGGETVFALDYGGGVDFFPTDRTVLRFEIGDRAVRYPGPVVDSDLRIREDAFFSHDFRFAIGGGVRF